MTLKNLQHEQFYLLQSSDMMDMHMDMIQKNPKVIDLMVFFKMNCRCDFSMSQYLSILKEYSKEDIATALAAHMIERRESILRSQKKRENE